MVNSLLEDKLLEEEITLLFQIIWYQFKRTGYLPNVHFEIFVDTRHVMEQKNEYNLL